MPGISEDLINSSEELDDDQVSARGGRRKASTSTLIDKVVLENRERFQPSAYAESYDDHEEDEEWTVLSPRDNQDFSKVVQQKRSLLSSLRRHIGFLMCFLAFLTFVMAMLVCTVWAVPGIFTDTLVIAPNDTVMAAYQVDTQDTANILYTLPSLIDKVAHDSDSEPLVIYNGTCDDIVPSSVEVHINDSVDMSAESERISVGHLYLVTYSTLDYIVKLSLSSNKSPSECYASLHLFKDYFSFKSFLDSNDTSQAESSYEFCNNSTINFTLVVKDRASYYFFGLYAANRGQLKSVSVQASGTIFFYGISFLLNQVCQINPYDSINSSCQVPTGHQTDYADVCLLMTRGTPYMYIPDTDPDSTTLTTVTMGNNNDNNDNNDDIIQLKRKVTTYWGINRLAVFVCLFVPLLMSCCVLTILTPRRTNYGSYVRVNRKKPLN